MGSHSRVPSFMGSTLSWPILHGFTLSCPILHGFHTLVDPPLMGSTSRGPIYGFCISRTYLHGFHTLVDLSMGFASRGPIFMGSTIVDPPSKVPHLVDLSSWVPHIVDSPSKVAHIVALLSWVLHLTDGQRTYIRGSHISGTYIHEFCISRT
jgi:hypothetical protein